MAYKTKWQEWSLPNKLTAIGTLIGIISLGLYCLEKAFQVPAWALATFVYIVFALLWVSIAPKFIQRGNAVGWVIGIVLVVLVLFALFMIWYTRGWYELWSLFLVYAFVFLLLSLAARKPKLVLPLIRWGGLVVFAVVTVSIVQSWEWLHGPGRFSADKIGVGVAKFNLDKDGKEQHGLIEQLNLTVREDKALRELIEVKDIRLPVVGDTEEKRFEHAQQIGEKIVATIVVFGTVTDRGTFTKIAIIPRPLGFINFELAMVNKIGDLPPVDVPQAHRVLKVIAGIAYFLRGDYPRAQAQFQEVLDAFEAVEGAIPVESIRLYLANSIIASSWGLFDERPLLDKAILHFQEASKSKNPFISAAGKSGIALAYRRLAQYVSPVQNLQSAIRMCSEALGSLPPDGDPYMLAVIYNNFGVSLEKLAQYQSAVDNLRHAIDAYRKGLELSSNLPAFAQAKSWTNLGVAHEKLANYEEPVRNLTLAIDMHKKAESSLSKDDGEYPQLKATIKSNLGVTYSKLADYQDELNNLKRAREALEGSLGCLTREKFPESFGITHFNIGHVHWDLVKYENAQLNLYRSILFLSCSLAVLDQLGMLKARLAADALVEIQQVHGEAYLLEVLESEPKPKGCVYDSREILAAIQRWRSRGD